ncbi:hypothetical protein PUN28_003389 [Cardiocondyla obscurior]|uniref:Uncharacterized protein n=1 Tax=Cardiocondyla obscurior TaxID=286306 RepID=A0AAW2GLJ5_9HYME
MSLSTEKKKKTRCARALCLHKTQPKYVMSLQVFDIKICDKALHAVYAINKIIALNKRIANFLIIASTKIMLFILRREINREQIVELKKKKKREKNTIGLLLRI